MTLEKWYQLYHSRSMETFYRWHRTDAPAFSADNAWSGLWGSEFSEDGSRTKCPTCDGTGDGWRDCPACHGNPDDCERCANAGTIDECEGCEGEGWQDCVRGYSCCWTAQNLADYMTAHAGDLADDWGKVIVFEGEQVDTGFDGEPTAVPETIVKEMTWTEFKKTLA